jgi:hypothetical protein
VLFVKVVLTAWNKGAACTKTALPAQPLNTQFRNTTDPVAHKAPPVPAPSTGGRPFSTVIPSSSSKPSPAAGANLNARCCPAQSNTGAPTPTIESD